MMPVTINYKQTLFQKKGKTRNVKVVGFSPIKGPLCFLKQETLPLLLSTGWFQERIRA